MGVESAVLSHFRGPVSRAACVFPFGFAALASGDAQQVAEGEVSVAAFGRKVRHGSCLLVCRDGAAPVGGRVNEETVL
jgi:hypothetical protein